MTHEPFTKLLLLAIVTLQQLYSNKAIDFLSLKYLTISAQWLPLELFWASEPTLEERKVLGSARNPLYFTKITKMIDCNAAADKDQTFCRTQVSWKVKLKCQ